MPTFEGLDSLPPAPGRYHVHMPVARDLSGRNVGLDVIVHQGAEPGPTLTVLSGLHGDEWLHLEFFGRLDSEIDHAALRGRVLLVPVANAAAFANLARNVLHEADAPDMNRVFPVTPRPQNGLPEQLAAKLAHEVLARSDALLDFHLGIWGSTLASSIVGT
ncbi:MAG TPA: succinylglutamate desuccinylase/aspartoacylase family protein, partial [Trueperaceae bacterium]|nr:succinylglutamate desuccinylase/aspartoacylase family protein [Trueperaceae bacterium]